MNELEQTIYATVYGARIIEAMERESFFWDGEIPEGWRNKHTEQAKADARRAVELHREGE